MTISSYRAKLNIEMATKKLDKKRNNKVKELQTHIKKFTEIGIALSKEKDRDKLLELILIEAKNLSNADGGTLYMMEGEKELRFEIVMTDSLGFHMGGTSKERVKFPNLKLYNGGGKANINQIAPYVALTGETINIPDAYEAEGFDFSGTKTFDKTTGYRSKSFLTLPLKNHEDEIIGVLQLLNAKDIGTGQIIPFDSHTQEIVEALSSQAAITITNKNLVRDLRNLFESFIKVIAGAIDKKSPYTGGHCQRVPEITMSIAKAVNRVDYGKYKDLELSYAQMYELYIASWLHDAGKVTIPEYVVDKSTKLETIFDRINLLETRFELLKAQDEIFYLKSKESVFTNKALSSDEKDRELNRLNELHKADIREIEDDFNFLKAVNLGGEFMSPEDIERVKRIGAREWVYHGKKQNFLTENEIKNLTIKRGTLTEEERQIINSHINVSIEMLEKIPYPKNLQDVPEIAGGHHEKMDGTGYPKGLKGDEMSVQARMMAIADIFEALTAKDRPYKKGKRLSEAIKIMVNMRDNNHIDPDLFQIFINEGVYKEYASLYLADYQNDEIPEDLLSRV